MAEAKTIVGFCQGCNVECYRSIRPLTPGVDSPSPELFQPVGDQSTPPANGPAVCDTCGGQLRFMPAVHEERSVNSTRGVGERLSAEQLLQAEKDEARALQRAARETSRQPESTTKPVVAVANEITELFRVEADETILHFTPTLDGVTVLTNKRLLKVRA